MLDAELRQAYLQAKFLHDKLYILYQNKGKEVNANTDVKDMANMSFLLREIDKMLDQIGKDTRKLKKAIDMVACLKWAKDPEGPPKIQTEYCTATPDIKDGVRMPTDRSSPEYKALLSALGIDPDLSNFVKISYKEMQLLADKLGEEGRPLPGGLLPTTYQTYELNIRARSGIEIE